MVFTCASRFDHCWPVSQEIKVRSPREPPNPVALNCAIAKMQSADQVHIHQAHRHHLDKAKYPALLTIPKTTGQYRRSGSMVSIQLQARTQLCDSDVFAAVTWHPV